MSDANPALFALSRELTQHEADVRILSLLEYLLCAALRMVRCSGEDRRLHAQWYGRYWLSR